MESEKADFSFEKIQEKSKKYRNGQKNFSVSHGKSRKNYSDEAKKSQKTDDPDEKAADFFRRRTEKCRKEREKKLKNLSNHPKKA